MPRKKLVRNVVDKKDEFIEPKEALEMLGITTTEDVPAVEEVPKVYVPQVHHVIISHREGPYEHSKEVGTISYHELTNSLKLATPNPRCEAVFKQFMNCDYPIKEDGVPRMISAANKQDWVTNLCKTTIGYKFEASEPWVHNEVR